jgi:murein DD-endopeptidase MepM/ murein hydrolase activator NlpD
MKVYLLAALLLTFSAPARACDGASGSLQHPAQGEIYRKYGFVEHPLLHTTRLHAGIDYRGPLGQPVIAAEAGTIVTASREGGYGNYIRIDHGNGLQTSYSHLTRIGAREGQCISKGEVIGTIGQTGLATEPHLHFEILKDTRFVDPLALLPARS